jgi:fibronectin type 3 domain-containing protein
MKQTILSPATAGGWVYHHVIVVIVLLFFSACAGNSAPKVTLAWDPNPQTTAIVGYNVYRSETPGCCYKKINSKPIHEPKYTDTLVERRRRYYYRVTTVDSKGQESSFSQEVSAVPKE